MIWYIENYQRSRREREGLEALASRVDWLIPIGWRIDSSVRLIWDADIAAAGRTFPLSLRYPNHFPLSPPVVLPRGSVERWSSHQYWPSGELCLEYGPDNWHSDLTGADMIESAHRLLQDEGTAPDQGSEVASRHETTRGQDLRGKFTRFIATRALADALASVPEGTMLPATAIGLLHEDSYVNMVSSITMPDGQTWREAFPQLATLGYERPIALFRWQAGAPLPPTDSLTAFRASAAAQDLVLPAVKHAILVQLCRIHAYFLSEQDDTASEVSVIPPQPYASRLDEDHVALAERKVAIVGCGSLGSKIAAMLARSGISGFLLVDDDILLPDCTSRSRLA